MDDGDDAGADGKAEMHDAGVGGDERLRAGQQRGGLGEGKFADHVVVGLDSVDEKGSSCAEPLDLVLAAEDEDFGAEFGGAEADQFARSARRASRATTRGVRRRVAGRAWAWRRRACGAAFR